MAYIGRSGWNTVLLAGKVPDDEILELVDASYQMVLAKLPKSRRPPSPT
jgi:predicted DNA-binding protein (MmcQ/YjbR family)